MRKTVPYSFLALGCSALFVMTAAFAQGPESGPQQGGPRLVVEEALDEIEKSFDPVATGESIPLEPFLSEVPGTQAEGHRPAETVPLPGEALEVKIIPLLHAEAAGMIETLNGMKSPEGKVTYNEEDRTLVLEDLPDQLEEMSDFIRETDVALQTQAFELKYVPAEDVVPAVRQHLTKNIGQARVGKEGKSVVVTDTPLVIGAVTELVRGLDVFNAEVSVGVHVIGIILNDEHPDGVDWEAIVSGYQKLSRLNGAGDTDGPLSLGTVSREDYAVLLEALDTVGVVSTLSEENKVVDNDMTGVIDCPASPVRIEDSAEAGPASLRPMAEAGPASLRPMAEAGFASTPKAAGPVSSEGQATVRLFVTPTVEKGAPLQVGIKIKDTSPEEVMVQMKDGATIVIGGLFEDVLLASPWKIPLLGDLPLLGFVFRNEGEELRKAETVIFLTIQTKEKNNL